MRHCIDALIANERHISDELIDMVLKNIKE